MCLLSFSAPICSCFIHCILFYTVFLCHFRESSINSTGSGAGHWEKQEPSLVTLWIENAQCYHQRVLLMLSDWRTCPLFMAQLDRPAVINAMVEPASLPDPDSPPLAYFTQCTVSGWGVTWLNSYQLSPELRSVDVNIFSNCEYYYYFRITDNMICAGSRYGGKDSCQVRHRAVVVFETSFVVTGHRISPTCNNMSNEINVLKGPLCRIQFIQFNSQFDQWISIWLTAKNHPSELLVFLILLKLHTAH